MKRIFWIGSHFFQSSLVDCGYEVYFFNFEDVKVFGWSDLVNIAGFEPDVVVVADKSRPPFVLGVETFPCITVFYAVDTHIHSWYHLYAQAFDICLVCLQDHLEPFRHKNIPSERILWCPPFARDEDNPYEGEQILWDCLFVGNVNVENLPKRVKFFEELSSYTHVHVERGAYVKLFAKGRVLINHCEHDDLNFRVFEALGCGGCLVTPRIGHGLESLFIDGEDLAYYEQHNAEDAARVIKNLLENDNLRKKMAERGLAKVNAGHRAKHRANALKNVLNSHDNWQEIIKKRQDNATAIRNTWLRQVYLLFADVLEVEDLRMAYLKASRGLY